MRSEGTGNQAMGELRNQIWFEHHAVSIGVDEDKNQHRWIITMPFKLVLPGNCAAKQNSVGSQSGKAQTLLGNTYYCQYTAKTVWSINQGVKVFHVQSVSPDESPGK